MSEFLANRTERPEKLTSILRRLQAGEACDPVAEGLSGGELHTLCDLHSQVAREGLAQIAPAVAPGHPVDQFRQENQALREAIARMRAATDPIAVRQAYNDLNDIEKHYQRKEHLVFSCLERHGIVGPSTVMWGKDDEVRAMLKDIGRALRNGQYDAAVAERAFAAIEEMMFKEENILLPMCLQKFGENEWAEIWASSPRYGWCLVLPREGYRPPASYEPTAAPKGGVQLPTGHLTIDQLTALFSNLPVDVTFVDANDRVAFFSEGPDRVFARSRAIIGRKVQHCHPPKSVDTVNQILEDFKSGRQNVAEFWLEFHGRFVHVRYFAVRDADGAYMGTLEVTQDATKIRALTGERRLLQYDSAPAGVA